MRLLTELEVQTYRKQLIDSEGDMEKAAISLEVMRDIIFTCRRKANPMAEAEEAPKIPKAKKVKGASSVTGKLSGIDINNLMG